MTTTYEIYLTIENETKTKMVYTASGFEHNGYDVMVFETLAEAKNHYFNINKKFLKQDGFDINVTVYLERVTPKTDESGDYTYKIIGQKNIKVT